jgi:hypothetical protein
VALTVFIYDLQGKEVFRQVIAAAEKMVTLPANLTAGTYLIRLQDIQGRNKTQKILLMP